MPSLVSRKHLGDIFKFVSHPGYNTVSGIFRNNSGATRTLFSLVGMPVKLSGGKWVPVLATDEANITGLVMSEEYVDTLANNTDWGTKVQVMVRGPALYDKDALPAADIAGTPFTLATIVTALAALSPPLIAQAEPATSQTQAT